MRFLILLLSLMNPELINYCALEGLDQPCNGQVGAVKNVYVIRASDVIFIPECCDDDHEISDETPIQVKGGTGFLRYFFLPDVCSYNEVSRKTKAGTVWEQRVEGMHPGLRPEVSKEICKLKDGHYILICELYTGKRLLLGDLNNPMQFQSSTTTGRERKARNGSEFIFTRQASCPACFISEAAEIPNEEGTPWAFLSVISEDPCTPVLVYAVGSTLSDGTQINTSTSGTYAVLRYSFGPLGFPWYTAEIDPDADATAIASWTYVGGSRTSAQFEDEVVDRIQAGSLGADWQFFPHYLAYTLNVTQVQILLAVVEGALVSNVTGRTLIVDPTQLLRVSRSGTNGSIIVETYKDCITIINWGDGTISSTGLTGGTRTTLSHTYGSSGTYEVSLYASPGNIKVLELPSIESFNAEPMDSLLELDIEDASIGESLDLSQFPKIGTLFSRGSSVTSVQLPPSQSTSGTPLPMLFEFVVPAAETDASFDFNTANGNDFLVDWGDGSAPETFTQSGAPFLLTCSHTYSNSVDRTVQVFGSPTSIIWFIMILYETSQLELYYNAALARVLLENCAFLGDKLALWASWDNIPLLQVQNCDLAKFDLATNTAITSVLLDNNNFSSPEMDLIIDQLWQNRAVTASVFNLTSNPGSPSATSIDKINGTGAYVGEGLNSDYGWTVTY